MRNIENNQILTNLAVSNKNDTVLDSCFSSFVLDSKYNIFFKEFFMSELLKMKIGWSVLHIWQNIIHSVPPTACYCI